MNVTSGVTRVIRATDQGILGKMDLLDGKWRLNKSIEPHAGFLGL